MDFRDQIRQICQELTRSLVDHLTDPRLRIDWHSLTQPVLSVRVWVRDEGDTLGSEPKYHDVCNRVPPQLDLAFPLRNGAKGLERSAPPGCTMKFSKQYLQTHSSIDVASSGPEFAHVHNSTAHVSNSAADHRRGICDDPEDTQDSYPSKRRKITGSLRPLSSTSTTGHDNNSQRQMQVDHRSFPRRRPLHPETPPLKPTTLDKLIVGIWEGIHGSITIDLDEFTAWFGATPLNSNALLPTSNGGTGRLGINAKALHTFSQKNIFCRQVTQASRTCRALEVIVQARWMEHFDAHVRARILSDPDITPAKHRKLALAEACKDFGWSETELRNKMSIWKSYKEVKDAAGWAALVFAGMGFYRFCKYRVGLDQAGLRRLRNLRPQLEVAADTLQPRWRELLEMVKGGDDDDDKEGGLTEPKFHGHPHDWVVSRDGSDPVLLCSTYYKYDPCFEYEQIDQCVLDQNIWPGGGFGAQQQHDPRWVIPVDGFVAESFPTSTSSFACEVCREQQSDDPKLNLCHCFPTLFGNQERPPCPVQVFRTPDGRNNGLLALCPFERGAGIGEFVGVITKGLRNVDVMECETRTLEMTTADCCGASASAPGTRTRKQLKYQIWQGRRGNFTRFVNHSCKPNAQFQRFVWRGKERVLLTSKGIEAGAEITVDYSDYYWRGLDKKCLCGEACCRYKRESHT